MSKETIENLISYLNDTHILIHVITEEKLVYINSGKRYSLFKELREV